MKTDPNEGINPTTPDGFTSSSPIGGGLTKREYFAAVAMQGLWAAWTPGLGVNVTDVVNRAVETADQLIQELNNTAQ